MTTTLKDVETLPLATADQAAAAELLLGQEVFFAKLAQAGIPVANEQDALEAWTLGWNLRQCKAAAMAKQAQESGSFAAANAQVREIMDQSGLFPSTTKQAEEQELLSAALAVSSDPDMYRALFSAAVLEQQAAQPSA
jgi:L-2-hydroxyglutarate oxidase LhgO